MEVKNLLKADTLAFHAGIQILKIVKHRDLVRLHPAIQLLTIRQKGGVIQDTKIGNLINIRNNGTRTAANANCRLIKCKYLLITMLYLYFLM